MHVLVAPPRWRLASRPAIHMIWRATGNRSSRPMTRWLPVTATFMWTN